MCASTARNKRVKLALIFWRIFLYDIATKFLGTSAIRKTHVLLVPEAHVSLPSGHYQPRGAPDDVIALLSHNVVLQRFLFALIVG